MNNEARKKIAIVSDAVYPFNKGGKEKRIYELTTRLAADYNVTVYCMQWWSGGKTHIQDGVTYYAISPYHPLYSGKRRSITEAVFFALNCLRLLWHDFDVIDVDHVPHLALFTTKIVCFLKRKKMVVTWHEVWGKRYWKNYLGSWAGLIAYWTEKISVKLPDAIISVSEHTTRELVSTARTTKPIFTIPNGLDMDIIKSSPPYPRNFDVIYAGRLLWHKHVDVLLRAVAIAKQKRPDISLCVIGEGPERADLERLSEELGLRHNVDFFDFFEDQKVLYGLMKSSKVFALPSTREGFGIMAIEANACGLPVITINTEANAAKELIINNENGRLCQLQDQKLASCIEEVLANRKSPEFYVQYSEKYNWDNLLSKIKDVYGEKKHIREHERLVEEKHEAFQVSIVIPTYNSAKLLRAVLDAVFAQTFKNFEVICIDSGSKDETLSIISEYPIRRVTIKSEEFGHGRTRNYGARLAQGEYIVFLTHDAVPENEFWLEEMIRPFNDYIVVGTYGRQIPRPEENPLDKHFQLSLYGSHPIVWENDNFKQGDNIFSDANSAVRKNILLKYPYSDDIIVSEDYEWAARMLKLGYKIVYTVTGCVIHSHSYKLFELFKRNFDVGVSYKTIYTQNESRHFIHKGIRILGQEIKYLYKSGHSNLIPRAIVRDMVRFLGVQIGKYEQLFTKTIKRERLSAQRWYWK